MDISRRNFLTSCTIIPFMGNITFSNPNSFSRSVLKIGYSDKKMIYPRDLVKESISKEGEIYGKFHEGPYSFNPGRCPRSLDSITHKVSKLYIQYPYLMADIELLDTPSGHMLKNIMMNTDVAFRAAWWGDWDDDNGISIVNSFKIYTIDAMPTDIANPL